MTKTIDGLRRQRLTLEEWLELMDQAVDLVISERDDLGKKPTKPAERQHELVFDSGCNQCGEPIHWARTTKNDRPIALDRRPGPYVLTQDGEADWQGSGGYACHFDGEPDGCPSKRQPEDAEEEDNRPIRREWQDTYD
jgi:hypothetical protein